MRHFAVRTLCLLRTAAGQWAADRCDRLGAALAYYAMFSLFPLLLLSMTALGFALGSDDAMKARLIASVSGFASSAEVRSLLDDTLTNMQQHRTARGVGAIVGVVSLLFSASGVFSELSSSINSIWRVREHEPDSLRRRVVAIVRERALAFVIVGAAGLVVLASLGLATAITAMRESEGASAPTWLWGLAEFAGSTVILTGILAALFRWLPQAPVRWRDVTGGALIAAVALSILRRLMAFYLAHIGNYAAYGVVGGVLGLMVLVYLSSLVILFGVEFARAQADGRQPRMQGASAQGGSP